jgi:hypothetical protein
LLLSGVLDLALIGLIVAFWGTGGIESELYVLYYPMLFAFALVFAPRIVAFFGGAAVVTYALVCIANDTGIFGSSDDAKALTMRLITMAATAGLGSYYWRIQRTRRHEAAGPAAALGR